MPIRLCITYNNSSFAVVTEPNHGAISTAAKQKLKIKSKKQPLRLFVKQRAGGIVELHVSACQTHAAAALRPLTRGDFLGAIAGPPSATAPRGCTTTARCR
jgi:hypothetical protein